MQEDGRQRDYGIAPPRYRLPEATHVGRVRLQVSDLARSVAYYRDVLGFDVQQADSTAQLFVSNATDYLIELQHVRGTRAVPRGSVLGLYHFAILVPTRAALAQFVRHLARRQVQFGAADHLVSEAIYLWDPDGLGIEVYTDRPRHAWQANGRELVMTTERLDLNGLVESVPSDVTWSGMPAGTTMGHIHLSVGDLKEASAFFHGALGLDTMVWTYPGALFMSAGGYHHHVGTNAWAMGARLATPSDARLVEWEIVVPSAADVTGAEDSLRAAGYAAREGRTVDPWGTALRVIAAS